MECPSTSILRTPQSITSAKDFCRSGCSYDDFSSALPHWNHGYPLSGNQVHWKGRFWMLSSQPVKDHLLCTLAPCRSDYCLRTESRGACPLPGSRRREEKIPCIWTEEWKKMNGWSLYLALGASYYPTIWLGSNSVDVSLSQIAPTSVGQDKKMERGKISNPSIHPGENRVQTPSYMETRLLIWVRMKA